MNSHKRLVAMLIGLSLMTMRSSIADEPQKLKTNPPEQSQKNAVEFQRKIESMLRGGWSVKRKKNIITVNRKKPIEYYSRLSLPSLNLTELKAQGFVHSMNYIITLEFFPSMSKAEVDKHRAENQRIEEHYYHEHPQPKDRKPLGLPKKVEDSLHHIPNIITDKYSVLVVPCIQGPGLAFFNEKEKKECEAVERDVRRLLKVSK